jgi:4-methyl-5(b-hydroxyethyl)-thiazole monophosphate biosynthesis
MLREQKAAGRLYAAICASPAIVFEHHGLLEGAAATSHPGFQSKLTNQEYGLGVFLCASQFRRIGSHLLDIRYLIACVWCRSVAERVVEVGKLTTSQGPGTAFEFALSLVKQLYGPEKMKEIAGPMVMYPASILES